MTLRLRLNDRPGGDGGVFWDHHDTIPHFIKGMIHLVIKGERFDDHVITNTGIFINDRALNFAIAANPERRAIGLVAIPVGTHHDRVFYFSAASDNTAQPDQTMFQNSVINSAAFRQEDILASRASYAGTG